MRRAILAGIATMVLAGLGASPALACDEASHVQADHAPGRNADAPLVIGDSTLILSAPILGHLGIEADAHGCRQFDDGIGIVAARPDVPDAVVLALGANGPVSRAQIAHARAVLGAERFLLLVTPANLASSAASMRAAARAHPDRVLALDWAAFSAGHDSWFDGDGLHVNQTGARVYARFIRDGLLPFLGAPHGRPLDLPDNADAPGVKPCGSVRAYGRTIAVSVTRGAQRMTCADARKRMAGPRLRPPQDWTYYDWRAVGRGPWTDVMAGHHRSIVIAGIDAARASH